MRARLILLAVSLAWLGACQPNPTVFRGSAQFPGGPSACHARCASEGLEMSGFVYSGEFATSCVCRPPGAAAAPAASSAPASSAESAESAGDPLADRGPGDASGADLDSSSADSAGAQVSVEAAAAAAAAANARAAQPMLQHRKP